MHGRVRTRVLGGLASLALAGAGLVALAPAASSVTQTFTLSDPQPSTFTVPAGVCQVTIAAWGGVGQDGLGGAGGDGGRIQADIPATPGQVLSVLVGENGDDGGIGFNTGGLGNGDGGHGGGSSGVTRGATVLIVAGGGGGGGQNSGLNGGNGGVAVAFPPDPGSGQDGVANGGAGGAGGAANGTRGNGGNANQIIGNAGGGGAGADPGLGDTSAGSDSNGGGGGGGNTAPTATALADPGGINSRDGQVTITAVPRVGCDPVLQVRKVVTGTAPSGFTVVVNCTREVNQPASVSAQAVQITVDNVPLPFNKDGTPDGSSPPSGWSVSNGVWEHAAANLGPGVGANLGSACTATETVTAGAQLVTYACSFDTIASDGVVGAGCPGASSGPSASPQTVTFEADGDIGVLTVTNVFLVARFTG